MLHIVPVQDKSRQAQLAQLFAVDYSDRAFAYLALDEDADGNANALIGFLQFTVGDGFAEVISLTQQEGSDDEEAMQIMARAAFSFIDRIGVPEVRIPKTVCSEKLMKLLRMEDKGDFWSLDVAKYSGTRCGDR